MTSDGEKGLKAIMRVLPKKNPLYKMIKENTISEKEVFEIINACSVGAAFNRKMFSNLFLILISIRTVKRQNFQIIRELIRRYRFRQKLSPIQREYFENCIVNGWSEEKRKRFVAREIISVLKLIDANSTDRKDFYENKINLQYLINKLYKNPVEYEQILVSQYREIYEIEHMTKRLVGLVGNITEKFNNIDESYLAIKFGRQINNKVFRKKDGR